MKKLLTISIACFLIMHMIYAQGGSFAELASISTPAKNYFVPGSFLDKSLYFGSAWVKAKLLKADNSVVSNDSVLFNFDKIDRALLITTDFKNIFEVDRREYKAVIFYLHDSAYLFKHIDYINDKDLFEIVINSKDKYSLCKVQRTKIVKFNSAIGLQPGSVSPFDKYEDVVMYYIFFPNREYKKIFMLKKAAIERLFRLDPDGQKVDAYLDLIGKKEFSEDDLIHLINYLNS